VKFWCGFFGVAFGVFLSSAAWTENPETRGGCYLAACVIGAVLVGFIARDPQDWF
jgi:hypothetical protein